MKATCILAPVTHTTAPHHTTQHESCMGGGGWTPQENGNYILVSNCECVQDKVLGDLHPLSYTMGVTLQHLERELHVITGNSSTQHLAAVNPTTCYSPGTTNKKLTKWGGKVSK